MYTVYIWFIYISIPWCLQVNQKPAYYAFLLPLHQESHHHRSDYGPTWRPGRFDTLLNEQHRFAEQFDRFADGIDGIDCWKYLMQLDNCTDEQDYVEIDRYDVCICSPWRCGQIWIEFFVARLPRLKSFVNLVLSAARRGGPWFSLWDVFLNVCAVNTSPVIILQLHVP